MDELANVVEASTNAKRLVQWISTKMADEFQNDFVDDYEKEDLGEKDQHPNKNFFVPMSIQYNVEANTKQQDTDSEEPLVNIVIDLTKKRQDSLSITGSWKGDNFKRENLNFCVAVDRFIPHFGLLRVCTAANNDGNMEDIDALLGCPLWLPHREAVLEKFDSLSKNERNHVCTLLFATINWFRELLLGVVLCSTKYRINVAFL